MYCCCCYEIKLIDIPLIVYVIYLTVYVIPQTTMETDACTLLWHLVFNVLYVYIILYYIILYYIILYYIILYDMI